ncbi:MAG: HipA domain-containing protein, partial [Flavobacterium sp.]
MKNYKKKYLARLQNVTKEVHESETFYGRRCLYCYEPLFDSHSDLHEACNKRFFGQLKTPQLNYNLENLQELASKVIQSQMAVTGVQAKVSLSLYRKEEKNLTKKLTIVGLYGDYILKPPSDYYEQLPELESATMHMAEVCGIKVVPHSLVKLQDGTLCYITKRVDRTRKSKLHMEDMCQLSERLTEDKYKGSHEQVAKLVLKYSSTPLLDVSNFYEQVLFSFFTGNSDMHLKNFSLLEKEGQGLSLCPAYDLVPTTLVNPADTEELALTLNAKKRKLKYSDFLAAFEKGGLNKKVLDNTLELFV